MKKIYYPFLVLVIFSIQLKSQNNCLNFDGINDNVIVPDATSLNLTTAITIEAWIKIDNPSASKPIETILVKGNLILDWIHKPRIIFGKGLIWSMDHDLSAADASFLGENIYDVSGDDETVSEVGDVNGDGYNDFIIAATDNNESAYKAGQTYLILGKASGWSMDTDLSTADASFLGENAQDASGKSVAGVGDVNGDNYDDFIIGARGNSDAGNSAGKTYLILGKSAGLTMDTDLSTADASFLGENAGDYSGWYLSGVGDVNGDGYDDLIISAKGNDDGGNAAGQTYLILGKASGWAMDTDLSTADASFLGENADDYSGMNVSGVGDVNGDGFDDFIIGVCLNGDAGNQAGQSYLILGKASGWSMDTDLSAADASFWGENAGDISGIDISGVGDVNGDGYDDFIIGAYKNHDGGCMAGQTYLILGKASGWSMDTDLSTADASFWGEDADDMSGRTVSGAGDVNGDGFDDFIISAYRDDDGGSFAGQTYLILGKASGWLMDIDLSASNASFWGEYADDYSGLGISGAGDVNGDGFDDFLIGARYNDEGATLAGQTYLLLSSVDIVEPPVFIGDDSWHHITGTFDGSNIKIYVDGVLKDTKARTSNIVSTTDDLKIGIFRDCIKRGFCGKIDEVRIWSDTRTQIEIQNWMHKTEGLNNEDNLVSVWHFDETSVGLGSVIDSKGNNNGTPTNMDNSDCVTSTAPIGDESNIGTGTSNLTETANVPVDITWDTGGDPGANAIFSAIQINETEDSRCKCDIIIKFS